MPYKDKALGKATKKIYNKKYNPVYKATHKKEAAATYNAYYQKNKEHLKAETKRRYRENVPRHLLYAAKQRADFFNLPFDICAEDIAVPDVCPIFGTPFETGCRNNAASIDRVRPERGYTKPNTRIISFRANRMKNSASLEDLRKLVAWLEKEYEENP